MRNEKNDDIVKLIESVNAEEKVNIEGYTLTRYLGCGAIAHVFEAHNDRFGRIKRALKLPVNADTMGDLKTRQIILSALANSPYSVNLIDQGSYNDFPYIIEDFHEQSMSRLIEENRQNNALPSIEDITKVAKQLFNGIHYFHNLRETNRAATETLQLECLTHNTIKPGNIMVELDGRNGGFLLKYNDFGIRIEEAGDGKMKIKNNTSVHSIRSIDKEGKLTNELYASSEVRDALLLGTEEIPATVESDLRSIGAILYAYATGRAPQAGHSDPREARSDLPEHLSSFFNKILHGDPKQRFSSALEALTSFQTGKIAVADRYIYGISRLGDDKYCIFKRSMENNTPLSRLTRTEFAAKEDFVPQLTYIPEHQLFLIFSRGDGCSNISTYDRDLTKLKSADITDQNKNKHNDIEFKKHKLNGQIVATVYGCFGDKYYGIGYSLPELNKQSSWEFAKIVSGNWRKYKSKLNSQLQNISVEKGIVWLKNTYPRNYFNIEGHVTSAFAIQ